MPRCAFPRPSTIGGYWYLCPFPEAEVGSVCFAPFGKGRMSGVIEKIERNLNEQLSPVPMNKIKEILAIE